MNENEFREQLNKIKIKPKSNQCYKFNTNIENMKNVYLVLIKKNNKSKKFDVIEIGNNFISSCRISENNIINKCKYISTLKFKKEVLELNKTNLVLNKIIKSILKNIKK